MTEQPGLFDLPDPPSPPPATTTAGRGRRRETWIRRVVADLHVLDRHALHDAALDRLDTGIVIDLGPLDDPEDPAPPDVREEIGTSNAAAAQCWIEPTEGFPPDLLEALRIDAVELDATDAAPDRVRLTWSVTVRILDADAVRMLARTTCEPDDAALAEIDRSFAAAWNHAAPADAPLGGMPGMIGTPVSVEIARVPAR